MVKPKYTEVGKPIVQARLKGQSTCSKIFWLHIEISLLAFRWYDTNLAIVPNLVNMPRQSKAWRKLYENYPCCLEQNHRPDGRGRGCSLPLKLEPLFLESCCCWVCMFCMNRIEDLINIRLQFQCSLILLLHEFVYCPPNSILLYWSR